MSKITSPSLPFQSTPSVGRATLASSNSSQWQYISIHALRGEGDHTLSDPQNMPVKFQSTPSVGRATFGSIKINRVCNISIHALRGEGDSSPALPPATPEGFQSTPSVGRATCVVWAFRCSVVDFNPRPPWGGRRGSAFDLLFVRSYFNPRPPWGGRPLTANPYQTIQKFQSTPSVGRATRPSTTQKRRQSISIHALRGEGDFSVAGTVQCSVEFQSTPSVGRATPVWLGA